MWGRKMTKVKDKQNGKIYAKKEKKSQNQIRVDVIVVFALIVVIVLADHPPLHRRINEHRRREIVVIYEEKRFTRCRCFKEKKHNGACFP
jgi:hypothetical protein